ncbi:MAG: hypothetical protein JXI32_04290 [Deltaproteobacteria bacterium]|nr:hypothetical protein [Deltaproteobacteria bacterium]
MDDTISRIMEIEKRCADEIEGAQQASRRKIESHRKTVEERKAEECARITGENEARLKEAVAEAQRKTETAFHTAEGEMEALSRDPSLGREIRERIVSILLTD